MATRPKYGDRRMASSSASRGATCNPVVVEVIDPVMSFAECAIRIDRCRVRNHTEFQVTLMGRVVAGLRTASCCCRAEHDQ